MLFETNKRAELAGFFSRKCHIVQCLTTFSEVASFRNCLVGHPDDTGSHLLQSAGPVCQCQSGSAQLYPGWKPAPYVLTRQETPAHVMTPPSRWPSPSAAGVHSDPFRPRETLSTPFWTIMTETFWDFCQSDLVCSPSEVIGNWLNDWALVPYKRRNLSLRRNVHTDSLSSLASYPIEALFLKIKRTELEADYLFPSSAKINNSRNIAALHLVQLYTFM